MNEILQYQYDKIYSFFKNTTEPFDELLWDGNTLQVINNDVVIEKYNYKDLLNLIYDLQKDFNSSK